MFKSESAKRSLANLTGNPSFQDFITANWNTDDFLSNTLNENNEMMSKIHRLLLQFGLAILPIDIGATEQREMETSKDRVIKIYEGHLKAEDNEKVTAVFDDFIYDINGEVESVSRDIDRYQAVVKKCSDTIVDQVYRKSCRVLRKFTLCMNHILGEDIFKKTQQFEYTRLVSKKLSTFQPFHCDFAPLSDHGWSDYMDVFNNTLMTPLSSLYFPEGGQLGFRNYQPRTCIQYFIDKGASEEPDTIELRDKETPVSYNLKGGITFKPHVLPNKTHLLTIEPGHMAIFGQHGIHQGAGYFESNLRYFRYIDLPSKF